MVLPNPEFVGDGFEVVDYGGHGRTLVVTGRWTSAAEEALSRFDLDSVALNYARGFRERDLEFLHPRMQVRRLFVLCRTLEDLTPVYRLAETLEVIKVDVASSAGLDLDLLPLVSEVATGWATVERSVRAATGLRRLLLLGYNEPDLRAIGDHPELETLRMKDRPLLRSLNGLESYPALQDLEVSSARFLTDFSALVGQSSSRLRRLSLESCKGLTRLDELARLEALEYLNVSDNGAIESLRPLFGTTRLEQLHAYESTVVTDGDLSPLLALPCLHELRMQSRRDYRPSVAEIRAQLAST